MFSIVTQIKLRSPLEFCHTWGMTHWMQYHPFEVVLIFWLVILAGWLGLVLWLTRDLEHMGDPTI